MDSTTSPTKRRALASLDANALVQSPKAPVDTLAKPSSAASSPVKNAELRKRALDAAAAAAVAKRQCVERDEDDRERSQSPDTTGSASSVFDTSAGDASWATTATDLEVERVGTISPAARPLPMTREQAREKVQILRLRLGLASYKLRTGQTAVSLADLQRVPLPPHASFKDTAASSSRTQQQSRPDDAFAQGTSQERKPARTSGEEVDDDDQMEEENDEEEHGQGTDVEEEEEEQMLPEPLIRSQDGDTSATPQRNSQLAGLTSSAVRGGAASGLVRLSMSQEAEEEE